MKRSVVFLLAAWGLLLPQVAAPAQEEEGAESHLQQGKAYAFSGDTVLAFAALDRALEANPDLADAHYFLGRLYLNRANAIESDFKDRLRAEEALMEAIRLEPGDPRFYLELGLLRLKQHMNLDASRLLGRSLSMAKDQGDPGMLAEIHYNLGFLSDMRYQALRHRRRAPMFGGPPTAQLNKMLDVRINRYSERFMDPTNAIEESGSLDRDEMVEHYRSALHHDPGHVGAATRLMGHLFDEFRLNEYYSVARKLVANRPESAEAHLFLGLGLHALGREDDAEGAFERALELMSPGEREAIESLETVLRRKDAASYRDMSEEARKRFEQDYWRLRDPLLLTGANERRLEHLARVAYADLRYAEPSTGQRGWETDRGMIFVRYGFPESIGSFSAQMGDDKYTQGKRQVIWSYGPDGPVLAFEETPGYLHARFAGDYRLVAENYRHILPAKYDRIPAIPEMLTVPVQIASFRAEATDEVAVEVHAELPIEELAAGLDMARGEIDEGLFILNRRGDRVVDRRATRTLEYADGPTVNNMRSWRVIMPESGKLTAAVEARDPLTWRAAVARDTFTAVPFDGDTLAVSDILVADVLRPLVEEPRSRDQLDIIANPALEFRSGDHIHLYYELYDLAEDEEGFASYEVALAVRVKELDRADGVTSLLGSLADAWGLTIVGDDRLELRYRREVRMEDRDRVVEFLSLDPNDVPAGEYEIRLRVWDRLAERLVSRNRIFHVVTSEE